MSEVESITEIIQQAKEELSAKLAVFGENMSENRALQVALVVGCSFRTVQRYCNGNPNEIRKPVIAEQMLIELERLAALDVEKQNQ